MQCWCGNPRLQTFGDGYLHCDQCQTLVAEQTSARFDPHVNDESKDLYGKDYWFGHQVQDLDCPDIISRSRSDLADRCIHWMRCILEFKLPPARVLEIGCAHGGFVAMLRQAGFDATGLELSPSIVRLATDTFRVPVLTGPIEDQNIPRHSLDVIVMMDVMEHLAEPVATLGRCMELLKPDGMMLVQTPSYPEQTTLPELNRRRHKFPQMLDKHEHLFLYSKSAARELFRKLNAPHIEFIPAIFGFYDMSFVVSQNPLSRIDPDEQTARLCRTVNGRFIQALLDLDARRLDLLSKYRNLRREHPASTPDNPSRLSLKSADIG